MNKKLAQQAHVNDRITRLEERMFNVEELSRSNIESEFDALLSHLKLRTKFVPSGTKIVKADNNIAERVVLTFYWIGLIGSVLGAFAFILWMIGVK